MNRITMGALALSAFALAACNNEEELTSAEAQDQLDTAFEEIDALPFYTQDRFQEFSDPEGHCGVAYEDRERGVAQEGGGRLTYRYPLPQMLLVDCTEMAEAFQSVRTTLAVDDAVTVLGERNVEKHQQDALENYKAEVTDSARRVYSLTNISTFGLE